MESKKRGGYRENAGRPGKKYPQSKLQKLIPTEIKDLILSVIDAEILKYENTI